MENKSAAATQTRAEAAKALVSPASATTTASSNNQTVTIIPSESSPGIKASEILARAASEVQQAVTKDELPQLGDLNDIKDPALRKLVEEKYRQWETGYNKKFEKLSEERKTLEKERETLKQNLDWSPERVNQLLSDPKFVQSAQTLAESRAPGQWQGTDEEWSALAPHEKQAFKQMQSQLQTLMLQQSQMQVKQIDDQLKTKFPDYDSDQINQFAVRYDKGEVDTGALRELVHKGLSFERAIEKAYQLGLKDRNGSVQEKMNASSSYPSNSVSLSDEKPVMQEGENSKNFFVRLARWNSQQMKLGKKTAY